MIKQFTFPALAAGLFIAASPATVRADVYASPPIYGGSGVTNRTGTVSCRIFNAGGKPVNITRRRIFTNTNVSVTLDGDNCSTALGANKYCEFSIFTTSNNAYSCKIATSQKGTKLRGVAEFQRSQDGLVTNALPITK